ncbi:MAG: GNAT family N-acetyltransferase [Lachnospiraceae bacterium]|nr:GNAT family N-acetyltransferase [Lachnospiraceae bacterium]
MKQAKNKEIEDISYIHCNLQEEYEVVTTTEGIDFSQVTKILNDYGLSSFDIGTQKRVFENSYAVVFLKKGELIIGMGRAISDGICQAAFYNLALHPDYCGMGLGYVVINELMKQVKGCNIIFYTHPKWVELYKHWGFKHMKTGFAKYVDEEYLGNEGFF